MAVDPQTLLWMLQTSSATEDTRKHFVSFSSMTSNRAVFIETTKKSSLVVQI